MSRPLENREDTNFLRSIAIILIVNTHLKKFYPITYLATGGIIGNSIFFMLSSFGLCLSEKKRPATLLEYYEKRVVRIYPSVWFSLLLLQLPLLIYTGKAADCGLLPFLGNFFYPPFWFIQAIMVFYFMGYFIIKRYSDKKFALAGSLLFLAYVFLYFKFTDLSRYSMGHLSASVIFFYLGIFIFGIFLGNRSDKIRYEGAGDVIGIIILLAIIYGNKYLMLKNMDFRAQFIEQLACFPLVYLLLKVSRSPLILKLAALPVLSKIILWTSACTLEIYMVHITLRDQFGMSNYSFPLNVLIFLSLTFVFVCLIGQPALRIRMNWDNSRLT